METKITNSFIDGNVIYLEFNKNVMPPVLAIYKNVSNNLLAKYCSIIIGFDGISINEYLCNIDDIKTIRLANDSEKEYFLNKIKNDKRINSNLFNN